MANNIARGMKSFGPQRVTDDAGRLPTRIVSFKQSTERWSSPHGCKEIPSCYSAMDLLWLASCPTQCVSPLKRSSQGFKGAVLGRPHQVIVIQVEESGLPRSLDPSPPNTYKLLRIFHRERPK